MTTHSDEWREEPDAGSSPFGASDPLVFRTDGTSPELRAAAAAIPSPKIRVREAAPRPPESRQLPTWTPASPVAGVAGAQTATKTPHATASHGIMNRAIRVAVLTSVGVVPLAIGGLLIWVGINLYG